MKKRFLVGFVLCISALLGSYMLANAQIVDDTDQSVSAQIEILRARQAGMRRAKAIIESTFNLPADAPEVRLTMPDMPDGLLGSYELYSRTLRVTNRQSANNFATLVTFHEIGHWFDNRIMAPRLVTPAGTYSEASPDLSVHELDAWRKAVKASKTWRGLNSLLDSPNTTPGSPREQFLRYVMTPEEMWARSFCEYVTIKCGDVELQKQMSTFVESDWPWNGSWYAEDFAPIYKALDELFSKQGWLKPATPSLTQ